MESYYKGDERYDADKPHYITTTASDWRQAHPTRADADRFLHGYMVSETYKREHYIVVSVAEYWDRRNMADSEGIEMEYRYRARISRRGLR